MLKAVIFDLFGTLIWLPRNSRPYLRLARATPGFSLRTSLVVHAPTLTSYCQILNQPTPPDITELQAELDADISAAALFEDSVAALRLVRNAGLQIGLISNLATPYIQAYRNLKIDQLVDVEVFSCEIGFAKPAAEIYHAGLERLNVAPEHTVMIGDSQRCDVDGPGRCGIKGILVERNPATAAEDSIQSLLEVAKYITTQQ